MNKKKPAQIFNLWTYKRDLYIHEKKPTDKILHTYQKAHACFKT